MALEGDAPMLIHLLERIFGKYRPRTERAEVPGLAEAPTLVAKADTILAAVANGELDPDVGDRLITALGSRARIEEAEELKARVQALEEQIYGRGLV